MISSSLCVDLDDFKDAPFIQKGGIGESHQLLKPLELQCIMTDHCQSDCGEFAMIKTSWQQMLTDGGGLWRIGASEGGGG